MTAETICEVIDSIIGSINPVGESNMDADRLENIKTYNAVIKHMIDKIFYVAHDNRTSRYMGSVDKICAEADNMAKDLKNYVEDYFDM